MKKITNFTEANEVLATYVATDMAGAYKLERMRQLMHLLDNPQDKIKVIHVAGTSGKTSTVYYSAALLGASGKKVGFSISPHVSEVNERLQVDNLPLSEEEFCNVLSDFLDLIEGFKLKPTYFELLIALAYWEFARRKVDYAVIEVGLGGLLDGTNVINRQDKICIITDIGLDHVNILGDNLIDIAKQKAGIIHPGNNVFAYSQDEAVNDVFKQTCLEKGADMHLLLQKENSDLSFLPLFQQRNIGLAAEAVNFALKRDFNASLSKKDLLKAAEVVIPARMEIYEKNDKIIIFDGAHNYQKIGALADSIKEKYPKETVAALVSFSEGRGYRLEGSLKALRKITGDVIFTSFTLHQDLPHGSVDPKELAKMSERENFESITTEENASKAFEVLLGRREKILLICGSFFMMNELRPLAEKL
jgi:dihydrofolate synthase/folylpolyglutamate synthase